MQIFEHKHFLIYFFLVFCVLSIGCIIGILTTPLTNTEPNFMNSAVYKMTNIELFKYILQRNIIVDFLIISLGITGYKMLPSIIIAYNGFSLGTSIVLLNYDPIMIFTMLFPHGYIELPILLFTGTCSFILADEIYKTELNLITLLTRHGNLNVKPILKTYLLKPYIFIILPGIIIAAILESTFTVWNIRTLVGV